MDTAPGNAVYDLLPFPDNNIPVFFFGHGSPSLAFKTDGNTSTGVPSHGTQSPLSTFLRAFGPALLEKYKPRGIVVFSAHWETEDERLVTDYGEENPLLMDYYNFLPYLYELKFRSRGDTMLAKRVVELYNLAGQKARLTDKSETRGTDGRGYDGPGLDHGVFIPFRLMFGEEFTEIPIVQVSIDSSLDPAKHWEIGKALAPLRNEGILILSGGLTVHNLRDRKCFNINTAGKTHKDFDRDMHKAINIPDNDKRRQALFDLTKHEGFRDCHPREDHFVPLYVAGGAGDGGEVRVITDLYGAPTFAFFQSLHGEASDNENETAKDDHSKSASSHQPNELQSP